MGQKRGLVTHGLDLGNPIAQIKLGQPVLLAEFDQLQDVKGAQAAFGMVGGEEEIDGTHPGGAHVNYRCSHQLSAQTIVGFQGESRVAEKET